MQTLSEIRMLLAERGLRPRRRVGQHFLHDKNQLMRLVAAAELEPGETVLEVGPGTGTLTEALLDAGADVVACEIDPDLAAILRDRLGDRIRLIVGDCLRGHALNPDLCAELAGRRFKLVANLPYDAASTLIAVLLGDHPGCTGLFVTVQREVADRMLARPGTKVYGALSVLVGALADVRRIAVIPASCFWPAPEVESAMLAIRPRAGHGVEDPAALGRFATRLFSSRRKQLGTIFGRDRADWPAGITPDLRPEALSPGQFVALLASERKD